MSKTYTQRTAALRATKINTRIVDAQKLLIYPGNGDKNVRTDVAEVLADHSEKINETESLISNVAIVVNNLETETVAKFEETDSNINNVNTKVDDNKTAADTKFQEVDSTIDEIEGSVSELNTAVDEIEGSVGELNTAVNELQERNYAYTDAENTFSNSNTFNEQVTVNNNVLISNGELTFTDLIDGTVIEPNGATGYRYVPGIPTNFNNGVCYDIGEITNETDLSTKTFSSTTGELVQTCELWFTTSATPPTTHKWPAGIYWIDSATGAAPTLIASKNYRIVFRNEPNKIIASIAYLY